jgi:hypothetical protein
MKQKAEIELELPGPMIELFAALLAESGWDRSCGPVPGVWTKKPAGARCLWSCAWSRSGGVIHPDRLLPLEFMTSDYLCWELADIAIRADVFGAKAAELSIRYFAGIETTSSLSWSREARALLGKIRHGYKDYIWPFLPPSLSGGVGGGGRLMNANIQRPGWEISKAEILIRAAGTGGY